MADIVKSVEFIDYYFDTNFASVDLTKGQNYENCVPFMTLYGGTDNQNTSCIDVYFSGTTTSGVVNFDRYTGEGNADAWAQIKCYVVEFYPSEVTVQSGTFYNSGSGTATETTSESFNKDNTFLVFNWKSQSSDQSWSSHLVRGRVLDNETQVDFYRYGSNGVVEGHWFIVESINGAFSVEHTELSFSDHGSIIPVANRWNYRQFVLISHATNSSYTYMDRALVRIYREISSHYYFGRFYPSYTIYGYCQVVNFLDTTKIFSFNSYPFAVGSSNLQVDHDFTDPTIFNIDVPLSPEEICSFSPTPHGRSAVDTTSNGYINESCVGVWTSASGVLSLRSDGDTVSKYVSTPNIINWNGYTLTSGINNYPFDPQETFVKSVENVSIDVSLWDNALELTKGQELSNCVVFRSQNIGDGESDLGSHFVEVYLEEPNLLIAGRGRAVNTAVVECSVVEFYPDQIKIQQGHGGTAGETVDQTIEEVDTDRAFIVSSSRGPYNSTNWQVFLIKSFIYDSNTVRHTRLSTESFYSFSWFIVEDISGNNFEVTQIQSDPISSDYYIKVVKNISWYNSFLLVSYSGGSPNSYMDRSCVRAYILDPHRIVIDLYYDSYNKYYSIQLVTITRSDRIYVNEVFETFYDTASVTYDLPDKFIEHKDSLSAFSSTMLSIGAVNSTSSNQQDIAFATISLDLDAETYTINNSTMTSLTRMFVFNIVDWRGYSSGTGIGRTDTKSLVESVETFVFDSTVSGSATAPRSVHYLTKGQDPNQCVPFATWAVQEDTAYMEKMQCNFYLYGDDNPYIMSQFSSGSAQAQKYNIQLVEFGKTHAKVQRGSTYMSGTDLDVTIEQVDLDKAFLVFYVNGHAWSSTYQYYFVCGWWVDNSTIHFRRYGGSSEVTISYYIVECLNDEWKVYHSHEYVNAAGTYIYLNIGGRVQNSKSLYLTSYSHTVGNDYADRSFFRTAVRPDDNIEFNRQYNSYNIDHVSADVIEFRKDLDIRTVFSYFTIDASDSSADRSIALSPNLDTSRSIIINNSLHNFSRSVGGGDQADYSFVKFSIDSPTSVSFERIPVGSYDTYGFYQIMEFPGYKAYYMEGHTYEEGYPAARTVRAYRADTGEVMDETTSSGTTGYFRLETTYSGAHYVICLDADAEPDFNDLIYGKIYPTVISGCFSDLMGWV